MSAFENFDRNDSIRSSSNRTLGLVFAVFFALVAFVPVLRRLPARWWAAPVSFVFLVAALFFPRVLAPLNRAWTGVGVVLHRVTNPIILGAIFYLVFTPFGWLLRRLGKDFLRLKPEPGADSYWIVRRPPGPAPDSLSNQF